MSEQVQNEKTTPSATKPRRMWLAALLGLLGGPLAQVYVGRFRRAVILWIGQFFLHFFLSFALVTFRFPYLLSSLCTIFILYYIFIVVDACLIARRDRNLPLKRYQRWWVYLLIYLLLYPANHAIAYTIKTFIGEAFVITGRSMDPTIQTGERILVDKFWTNPDRIKRDDIVVFRPKLPNPEPFVMRVIGLPGETIEIKDERLFIDGKPFDDHHAVFDGPKPVVPKYLLARSTVEYAKLLNYGPEKIPEDCFFVLGDNRRLSRDGRFLGPIPFSDYIGTARIIYWSQKHFFPNPNDPSRFNLGPIQWDRMGDRLD